MSMYCVDKELEKAPADLMYGQRVHSWVLVVPGKRDVDTAFFIDPCSARHQLTDADPQAPGAAQYVGVESVWNHRNYYVNMQDCSTTVQARLHRLTHRCKKRFFTDQAAEHCRRVGQTRGKS